jgi:AraC-like DNA-binding protein
MDHFSRNLELNEGLETDYVRILVYDLPASYAGNYNSYEYYRVCTIIDGEKHIRMNNEEFVYDRNEFLIMPPESSVNMKITRETHALVLELSDRLIEDIIHKSHFEPEVENELLHDEKNLYRKNTGIISLYLDKIVEAINCDERGKEFLIDLYSQEMAYKLLNIIGTTQALNNPDKNSIAKAIQIMKDNIREDLTINDIAHTVFMSPQLFCLKFRKLTGLSPSTYYLSLKLGEAKKMLEHSSVTEVSYNLGYDNISHFIKRFSDKYGITPKQYQMQHYGTHL